MSVLSIDFGPPNFRHGENAALRARSQDAGRRHPPASRSSRKGRPACGKYVEPSHASPTVATAGSMNDPQTHSPWYMTTGGTANQYSPSSACASEVRRRHCRHGSHSIGSAEPETTPPAQRLTSRARSGIRAPGTGGNVDARPASRMWPGRIRHPEPAHVVAQHLDSPPTAAGLLDRRPTIRRNTSLAPGGHRRRPDAGHPGDGRCAPEIVDGGVHWRRSLAPAKVSRKPAHR